jgi:prepilin-type N-terminal cleavage/methylation domain-containing protein
LEKLSNRRGITLIELIMTLAILAIVICPLMSTFVLSQQILSMGRDEMKSIQLVQTYMEEIKSMDELDTDLYVYNSENLAYEHIYDGLEGGYKVDVEITTEDDLLYYIQVVVLDGGEELNRLNGSKIFN